MTVVSGVGTVVGMTVRAEMPDMAGYGVGDGWSPLPWEWARERLERGHNYWLCTAAPDRRPHAMPVWGVWHDQEARFVVSCAPQARKARNLRANPQAVVATDDTIECLSVEGRCDELAAGDRFEQWIERYLGKYAAVAPDLSADFFRRNLMFEFVPERAFAVIERPDEFSTRATRWVFED